MIRRSLLILMALTLTACGGKAAPSSSSVPPSSAPAPTTATSPSPVTYTMHGQINGVSCDLTDARAQIIQVLDETKTLIGQGRSTRSTEGGCQVFQTFTVPDLPKAKFYTVNIGKRNGPTYSFAQLEKTGFEVSLKYGF